MSKSTAPSASRKMALIAFIQAQNCSNFPASWRHPAAATDSTTAAYYQRIARELEAARFDLAFVDDRLAMPDKYNNSHRDAVEYGIRTVKMDPNPIMLAMGFATNYLGVASTCSTTYNEPFHIARSFSTMDLMLGGRAGWNVVTSLNDSEAANYGREKHLGAEERYDRADEFMEVVLGHWDTWEDDAIIIDKPSGRFADPDKVHPLGHKGEWFASAGPLPVPRSAQGRPIIIQAGGSARGLEFAARWGEVIFSLFPTKEVGQKKYQALKAQIAKAGRNPEHARIATACFPVVAETRAMAEDQVALLDSLVKPIDQLVNLSELFNYDFAGRGMDDPFSDAEMENMTGNQSYKQRVVDISGTKNPSTNDFLKVTHRATIREFPLIYGTAGEVADQMEDWFVSGACDGFVTAPTYIPGTYEDFCRLVVPELQRRGVVKSEYLGPTLRENLGIPRAEIGDWK
ncbi:MAG: LLM class flavin-dependent oxidoreductase [Cellvibrionales bacterium]|nr:LLM class flavin-dependent oxidoreductase [Cellvibrionales bacterium]